MSKNKKKTKKPNPNQKEKSLKKKKKNYNKLLALAASHSIWVHHLPVNPWLRRYESDIALRKSFL